MRDCIIQRKVRESVRECSFFGHLSRKMLSFASSYLPRLPLVGHAFLFDWFSRALH
ncbi:uncharacterized protein G2W53_029638 [Senna tora]|uniref:Uncharacterized protein n=1 Tax=Senna tora TaxID=362788 RepID=A0A834TEG4_9FABA|nr:uncharacterized protein G2W53_029638 [Senna tora]